MTNADSHGVCLFSCCPPVVDDVRTLFLAQLLNSSHTVLCGNLLWSNSFASGKIKHEFDLLGTGRNFTVSAVGCTIALLIVIDRVYSNVTPLLVKGISVQFSFDGISHHFKGFVNSAL